MRTAQPMVFVIMPFAPEYRAGFEQVIQPAIERAGMHCVRADQEALGHIHHMMFERIFESAIVVADITGHNPNVFYELGVAHCAARRTITVVREDYVNRVPFDIMQYRALVYPAAPATPGEEDRQRLRAVIDKLAAELERMIKDSESGASNPVQDYLASRSPYTCTESLQAVNFGAELDEEAPRFADDELIHVGLTGSHFLQGLVAYMEKGERKQPLRVRLLLLHPEDHAGWGFVYHLREGRAVSADELTEFLEEDVAAQRKTQRQFERLCKRPEFSGTVTYYRGIPLFWAYLLDGQRLMVGHLAMNRTTSRNFPGSVLIKDDPRTASLFGYYKSCIDDLLEGIDPCPAPNRTSRKESPENPG